jgi:hypothetical protein
LPMHFLSCARQAFLSNACQRPSMRLAACSRNDPLDLKKLQMVQDDSVVHFSFVTNASSIQRAILQQIQDSSPSTQAELNVLYARQERVRMPNLSDHSYHTSGRSFEQKSLVQAKSARLTCFGFFPPNMAPISSLIRSSL